MIGEEPLVVAGNTIMCVMAESSLGSDFSSGGYEDQKTLTATCRTDDLPSVTILKKQGSARGENWRIDAVSKGATFTTITLTSETRA